MLNIFAYLTLCIFILVCYQLDADIFQNQLFENFSKNYFRNTIRVSNNLDPDQGRGITRPDLGPDCLQKLSTDDTRP